MNKLELLAPAGSPEALDAAVGAGADAVYFGLKDFNARARSANFAYSQAEAAVKSLRRLGKKSYITINTVFEQRESDRVFQMLNYLSCIGPDGVIVQDFGVVEMIKEFFPRFPKLHASTQMNIASARGANILSKNGVSRVVLARELTLREIREVRDGTNVELEVFVHGALCVSESGLCLFSSYLGGKSANRGLCTQACRRFYKTDNESESGYFFSTADLQLLEKLPELVDAGVNGLKIEGRMKSADYVGTVVRAYRNMLDSGRVEESKDILKNDFARSKTFFYFPVDLSDKTFPLNWLKPNQAGGVGISLGKILKTKNGRGLIQAENKRVVEGDSIRIHKADDSDRLTHKLVFVENSGVSGVWLSLPQGADVGDSVFLIQTRAMSRRYAPVLPKNLDGFRRVPGREKAPNIVLSKLLLPKKDFVKKLPEGLYASASKISDCFVLQSSRPVKVILAYTQKNAASLLEKGQVPFPPQDVILALDPYFPQERAADFAEEIPRLIEQGFTTFVVNNPGHFSFFRNTDALLIGGSYLYTFNRFAAVFVRGLGATALVSPLENNRQNLEKTFDVDTRAAIFIPVFAFPPLFRIRADLNLLYPWRKFSDSQGEEFSIAAAEGSVVIPEKPFSIVDKIPFLKEAGFKRFIVDFSNVNVKKRTYKEVMDAAKSGTPLEGVSRFNWKNGFWREA
ncbi:MAG: U32 family peptidase [Treponema sp.]|jgi:putative protease|nr:U32 family peptidase [Treponema sp.]